MVRATIPVEPELPSPPSFTEAKTRYHRVRAAGLDPDYWYVAAISSDLKRGEVREIEFWKRSIVLYRGRDGSVGAMENRCAHRQVRLSESGIVDGCDLVCQYHGWKYNRDGEVVDIWHETFGHDDPKFRVPRVPVVERYGLVWIFPGDPDRADEVPLPELPEAEPGSGWTMVAKEYHWKAHHSMVLENVSDYTHGYLHRKYQPFSKPRLVQCESHPDRDLVEIAYQAEIGAGKLLDAFMDRDQVRSGLMRLGYQYPYNWSNTDDYIRHFVSIIPRDEQHSHFFFILFVRSLRIPGTRYKIPRRVMRPFMEFGLRFTLDPIFAEDQMAVEWELDGYRRHWNRPMAELNPAVKAFQDLTIRKWSEYLERVEARRPKAVRERDVAAKKRKSRKAAQS